MTEEKKLALRYMAKAKTCAARAIEKIDSTLTTTQHRKWFAGLRQITQQVDQDLAAFLDKTAKGANFNEQAIFSINMQNNASLFNINVVAGTIEEVSGKSVDEMTDKELRYEGIDTETIYNIRLRAALEGIRDAINDALLVLNRHKPNFPIEEHTQKQESQKGA